ncbi:hypothetical protein KDX20_22125 [Burkholderia cenocepacia]|uniref:hypothetical protein n=1 Tax=Burkholderia cenocepacia TaxID=95486 RepID=UPI001B931655|nr:hypothetical protein [Burkholderia cenocepacia]MBR8157135.1 hypothetical protein [Burkholderia cenocepacia]
MNLFNFGGTNINPLLNALGSAPTGAFSGLNPAASAGASFGAVPSMAGADMGTAPLGGGIASMIANMDPSMRASLGALPAQPAAAGGGTPAMMSGLSMMLSRLQGNSQQPPQQLPMGDYAAPQASISSPNLIPMNQLVGRLLARGGA